MTDVVLLAGRGSSSWAVCRALRAAFGDVSLVVEDDEPAGLFLRRRARQFGWSTVAGQVAFVAYGRLAARRSRARRRAILSAAGLDDSPLPAAEMIRVSSANAQETVVLLRHLAPRVVVVNGTRILSRRVLEAVPAIFLNMHAGITPTYRGVHGGYWALVQGDHAHCGVTIHQVDPGIDTGPILYQTTFQPMVEDDFWTYPTLQLAAGVPLLIRAVADALSGELRPINGPGPSKLWSHPTLRSYFRSGLRQGIW